MLQRTDEIELFLSLAPPLRRLPPAQPSLLHTTAGTPGTPAFSTPIKLAPSTSALKRSGSKTSTPQEGNQDHVRRGWGPRMPGVSASASAPVVCESTSPAVGSVEGTANKGMLRHVSDLIFGWQ